MTSPVAIFDCDGTLIDGQASICEAMEAAFAGFDLPAPQRGDVRRAVGLSLPQAVRSLLPDEAEDLHHRIVEAYKREFRTARTEGRIAQPLVSGIPDLLDRLQAAGWQLAVATGMSDRGLDHCLAANGIADRFVSLQTADRHPSKPDPSMIDQVLADCAADRSQAVMIGDTTYDIQMAANAQVRGIGVDWGYHQPRELTACGAELVASSPAQIGEHLLS